MDVITDTVEAGVTEAARAEQAAVIERLRKQHVMPHEGLTARAVNRLGRLGPPPSEAPELLDWIAAVEPVLTYAKSAAFSLVLGKARLHTMLTWAKLGCTHELPEEAEPCGPCLEWASEAVPALFPQPTTTSR